MATSTILGIFISLRIVQQIIERYLAKLNRDYYENQERLDEAAKVLNMDAAGLEKTLAYSRDKFRFANLSSWIQLPVILGFIGLGGLGWAESLAQSFGFGQLVTGLIFFAIIGLLSSLLSTPFDYFYTFQVEEKHGFNRQKPKGFFIDRLKGLFVGLLLGGPLLAALLWVMQSSGAYWWVLAWALVFGFSLLTVWIYPTLLAPIFNKFTPLEDGELKHAIFDLAKKVDFGADDISVMDASTRSSHGNAYFTGVFGKKKIVLFDTLIKSMSTPEIIAIMAHELGHFKLHHIRWSLIRNFFTTGLLFYCIHLLEPYAALYETFGLDSGTSYGLLTVFSLWFGLISFLLQPIGSFLSRRNEFAADRFALDYSPNQRLLGDALLKLRESSQVMPISHPIFSAFYHSHPPILERLKAMGYI